MIMLFYPRPRTDSISFIEMYTFTCATDGRQPFTKYTRLLFWTVWRVAKLCFFVFISPQPDCMLVIRLHCAGNALISSTLLQSTLTESLTFGGHFENIFRNFPRTHRWSVLVSISYISGDICWYFRICTWTKIDSFSLE